VANLRNAGEIIRQRDFYAAQCQDFWHFGIPRLHTHRTIGPEDGGFAATGGTSVPQSESKQLDALSPVIAGCCGSGT
jgi:hypothetical protein